MQGAAFTTAADALNGDDFTIVFEAADRRNTGACRLAIDMDRAGPALADAAAEFGAFQIQFVAKHPQERHVARNIETVGLIVDGQGNHGEPAASCKSRGWAGLRENSYVACGDRPEGLCII